MKERIVAAAVRAPDLGVYSLPPPARHGQVLRLVASCYPDDDSVPHKCEQGFVTDAFRYVDRTEARTIATAASQTSGRDMKLNELFSEDLW